MLRHVCPRLDPSHAQSASAPNAESDTKLDLVHDQKSCTSLAFRNASCERRRASIVVCVNGRYYLCDSVRTMQDAKRPRGEDSLEDNDLESPVIDPNNLARVLDSSSESDALTGPRDERDPGPAMIGPHMKLLVPDGRTIHLSKSEVDKCALLRDDAFLAKETVNIPFTGCEVEAWRHGVRKGMQSLSKSDLVCAMQVSQSPSERLNVPIEGLD